MRTSHIICGLAAIAAALAAAVAKTHQDYNVYFKNEAGVPEIPEGRAVEIYNGLNWGPFTLATSIGSPQSNIGGVIPSTQPKSAAFDGITQEVSGDSSITAAGKTSYFALHGFHFGCTFNDLTSAGGANTPCAINVAGKLKGKEVATAGFAFKPSNPIAAEMTHALLPATFGGVDTISFSLAKSSVTVPFTVLLIDNFYYTVYY